MTLEKTQNTIETSASVSALLSIDFDPSEFSHFLEDTDWNDEEKAEYVQLVWNIMCQFVALGFNVHPIQQARDNCGKLVEDQTVSALSDDDMVDSSYCNLVEKFMRLNGVEAVADQQGVIDEQSD